MTKTIYSNPSKSRTIDDWPLGRNNTTIARFVVESNPNRGERISRTTENKFGIECKPKTTTYAARVVIVDGDDGKTYILEYSEFGFISVQSATLTGSHETIHPREQPERFAAIRDLIFSV